VRGTKETNLLLHHAHLRYSLCLQIYLFFPFFFKSISTQDIIEQLFLEQRVIEYEPNTDIPDACRDIIDQYFVLCMTPRYTIV
jgi:hypothetical protein